MPLTLTKTGNAVKVTDIDSAISFVNPRVNWSFNGDVLTLNINASTFKETIGSVEVDGDTPVSEEALESALSSVFPNPGGAGVPTLTDVLNEGQSAGNNRIVNLGAPQNPTDAATLESILLAPGFVEEDDGNISLDGLRMGKTIVLTSNSPKVISIAADANFDGEWHIGTKGWFIAKGTGPFTVVPGVGATVLKPAALSYVLTTNGKIEVQKLAVDNWIVSGNLDPV